MKLPAPVVLLSLAALLLAPGCGHLDLTPEGDPNRVLTGTVEFREPFTLPADAVVVVRVIDTKRDTEVQPTAVLGEPSTLAPRSSQPPRILGEQVIHGPGQPPIPFRIEFTATDPMLRAGLNVEARVSYGGRVRFFNVNSYAVTLSNVADRHTVWVNLVAK